MGQLTKDQVTWRYSFCGLKGTCSSRKLELMNGCIAKAHGNLFIPSTLAGSNFDSNGLSAKKLNKNMDIATDVYIDRVDGAPCFGTTLKLHSGGKN
ncbi:unnamed protein product, partial [Porites lobata]